MTDTELIGGEEPSRYNAIAPPVAAGSVDTPEFGKLLHSVIDYPQNWAMYPERRQKNRTEFIAHINAWGAHRQSDGWHMGRNSLDKIIEKIVADRDQWRERAEKAEADLKQVNEWRAAALASNQQLHELMVAKLAAAEAHVKELEAKIEAGKPKGYSEIIAMQRKEANDRKIGIK